MNGTTITKMRREDHGELEARLSVSGETWDVTRRSGSWQVENGSGKRDVLPQFAILLQEKARTFERVETRELYEATIASLSSKELMALEVIRAQTKVTEAWLKERRIAVSLVEALVEKRLATVEFPDRHDETFRIFRSVDEGKLAR